MQGSLYYRKLMIYMLTEIFVELKCATFHQVHSKLIGIIEREAGNQILTASQLEHQILPTLQLKHNILTALQFSQHLHPPWKLPFKIQLQPPIAFLNRRAPFRLYHQTNPKPAACSDTCLHKLPKKFAFHWNKASKAVSKISERLP